MKKSKLLPLAIMAAVTGAASLVGCDTYEQYTIDAPDDLQEKIDSIYDANNKVAGDTITVPITVSMVGADDNSSAWWTEFSQYFTIPANRLLHIELTNYTSGEGNWNNWNLCVATGQRDASDYAEYFVLRSDAYGWGGAAGTFDLAMIKTDYEETLLGNDDYWETFREKMQGAKVTIEIDHSRTGNCYVTATHVATDGTTFTETYEQAVSATADIVAFLIADGSHFNVNKAYTITSKVQAVDDQDAVALSVSGTPEILEVGQEDYWGEGVATVTYADGSSAVVDAADLSFTVPDLTTSGTKTIIVSYSKTKLGNYGPSVAAYYNVVVNNPVSSLDIVSMPYRTTYYYYDSAVQPLTTAGLEVSAVFADGSVGAIPVSSLQFSAIKAAAGTQDITVTYDGGSAITTTSFPVEVIQGTGLVGNPDCSTGWWEAFTEDQVVSSGQSVAMKFALLSDGTDNWHCPLGILRKADLTEYVVVRLDNFGWGDGYGTAVLESDWNWDLFAANLNGSDFVVTFTNNGDGTADIVFDAAWPNGETHYQKYMSITVDSSDVQAALTCEGACLIMHD